LACRSVCEGDDVARICSSSVKMATEVSSQEVSMARKFIAPQFHYDVDPIWLGGMVCPDANPRLRALHGYTHENSWWALIAETCRFGVSIWRSRIGGSERSLGDSFESETRVTPSQSQSVPTTTQDDVNATRFSRQGIWELPGRIIHYKHHRVWRPRLDFILHRMHPHCVA